MLISADSALMLLLIGIILMLIGMNQRVNQRGSGAYQR
jgi:hypothetical protein